MPFGICNAPATFERLEDSRVISVYLDVIVIDRTFQQHLLNLRKVFQSFQEAPTLSEGNMVPRAYYVA
jgi:hypothetical protein